MSMIWEETLFKYTENKEEETACWKESCRGDFRKNFLKVAKEWNRLLEDTGEFPAVDVSKNRSDKWTLGIIWS